MWTLTEDTSGWIFLCCFEAIFFHFYLSDDSGIGSNESHEMPGRPSRSVMIQDEPEVSMRSLSLLTAHYNCLPAGENLRGEQHQQLQEEQFSRLFQTGQSQPRHGRPEDVGGREI